MKVELLNLIKSRFEMSDFFGGYYLSLILPFIQIVSLVNLLERFQS